MWCSVQVLKVVSKTKQYLIHPSLNNYTNQTLLPLSHIFGLRECVCSCTLVETIKLFPIR